MDIVPVSEGALPNHQQLYRRLGSAVEGSLSMFDSNKGIPTRQDSHVSRYLFTVIEGSHYSHTPYLGHMGWQFIGGRTKERIGCSKLT